MSQKEEDDDTIELSDEEGEDGWTQNLQIPKHVHKFASVARLRFPRREASYDNFHQISQQNKREKIRWGGRVWFEQVGQHLPTDRVCCTGDSRITFAHTRPGGFTSTRPFCVCARCYDNFPVCGEVIEGVHWQPRRGVVDLYPFALRKGLAPGNHTMTILSAMPIRLTTTHIDLCGRMCSAYSGMDGRSGDHLAIELGEQFTFTVSWICTVCDPPTPPTQPGNLGSCGVCLLENLILVQLGCTPQHQLCYPCYKRIYRTPPHRCPFCRSDILVYRNKQTIQV